MFFGYSLTLYGISIVTTVVIYIQIYHSYNTPRANRSPDERQATKLCVWVAMVYSVCWTPFVLVQVFGVFGTYTELHFNLHGMTSAIGVIGSAVNPFLYAKMLPYYKDRMNYLFKRPTFHQEKKQ